MPRARGWKQERDVAALLESEPLFAALLEDDPSLREPLRAGLLQAMREGPRDEVFLAGQRLLSPRLWRYVPGASDAAHRVLVMKVRLSATTTPISVPTLSEFHVSPFFI